MKRITKFGIIGLLGFAMLAASCKKGPAANLYKTWELTDVNMDTDDVSVQALLEEGVTYTFNKDGTLSFTMSGTTKAGTYEVNEAATQLTSTIDGNSEAYDLHLTENNMKLTSGSQSMTFAAKQ